jgi:hypothetical protein
MKSAQQRFNEYLNESHETSDAVRELVNSYFDKSGSYAGAAGYLQTLVSELILHLPRDKRAEYRDRLYQQAQRNRNDLLINTIKEA